jgi:HlyD family secretion protein
MKRFLFWLAIIVVLAGAGGATYCHFHKPRPLADQFKTMKVRRADVKSSVNSTGTIQPVLSVQVGAFVSGPIRHVHVDFNSKVTKGQLLAEIDPLLSTAQRDQAKASLESARASLLEAEAKLEQTKSDWRRSEELLKQKAIADADYDSAKSAYKTAVAKVASCQATIAQNKGALETAETNVGYTKIMSPVDGIVTDRKVDPGQTVASQFQTPVLFVVAPDLEKKVNVLASVDEADIGLIREAQSRKSPVTFTVDAYPNDEFQGTIAQVRLAPTSVQNVVTYTVVVDAPNQQTKLLPGMTANLTFQIESHKNVLKIPSAALRFFPKPFQVRESDRSILDGKSTDGKTKEEDVDTEDDDLPPAKRPPKARYVWIIDGDLLAAVKVVTGLTDKKYTELVSGDLKEGQTLVTGLKTL